MKNASLPLLAARVLAVVFALGATACLVMDAQRDANESEQDVVGPEPAPAERPAEDDPVFLFSSKNASIAVDPGGEKEGQRSVFLSTSKSLIPAEIDLPQVEEADEDAEADDPADTVDGS